MADNTPTSAETLLNGAGQQASKSTSELTEKYDLLPKLIPNLNRHLVYPLLNHESDKEGLDDARMHDLAQAKYNLLKDSNMTDYVVQLWQEVNDSDEVPEEFATKRQKVLDSLQTYRDETSKILNTLEDEAVVGQLRSDKTANLKFLEEQHGITMDMVNALFDFGQFQYKCGLYDDALDLLFKYRLLSTDNDKGNEATWGRLASAILSGSWDDSMEEVQKLKESIETRLFNSPLAQLQHRTRLVHWALFPFFNHEPSRDTITELFFSPPYINTIQTACPWVLRYLAAAVITTRSRGPKNTGSYQKQLKDLVRVVRQEGYEYNDPITDFVAALYIDFDFEEAQKKLSEAEEVLRSDFFTLATADAFVEAARHLISESYCKIHQRIDIK